MRTSWTQPAGGAAAFIEEARVIDYNLDAWTVDVRTQFDQKFYPNIQVGSPYMHSNRGEGIYAMPEVNAKCLVCLPSDGPPPYIFAFIMPMETPEDPAGSTAATGAAATSVANATAQAGASRGAVFSGGRTRAKPGDIVMKGRDGNFVVLHRGGVLQVGSTELAQRLYIPIGNIIMDVSQNYEHHNAGGSINWGLSTSYTDTNPETEFRQTFRTYVGNDLSDVRVAVGKVHQPVDEPPNGEGGNNAKLNIGTDGQNSTIVTEFVVAPGGFVTESGAPTADASTLSVFRLFFDSNGGAFLRAQANVNVRVGKKLRLSMTDLEVTASNNAQITAGGLARLQGGTGVQITATKGAVTLNGGATPVAAVGSAVSVLITAPIPITVTVGGTPAEGFIVSGAQLTGFVTNGSPTVLVPSPG
jgi:hypothetical protein